MGPLVLAALELTLLGFALVLLGRLAIKPPLRRDFLLLLPWSVTLVAAGLAGLAALALAVVRWPWLLHVYAIITVIVGILAWVRARPAYGSRRGLPPGSLGLGRSLDAIGDRHFYRDQSRIHGPVFKMSQFGRPVVCVVGLETAREVLRSDALAGARLPYNRFLPKGTLRYMEPRAHGEEAPFFRKVLGSVDLPAHEALVRGSCRDMLARLSERSCTTPEGLPPRETLGSWAFIALASIFWGIPPGDRRLQALHEAQSKLEIGRGGGPRWKQAMREGLQSINDMMREVAGEEAREEGTVDESTALSTMLSEDPRALDDPSRAHNLTLVFRLAVTDVTSLLDWLVAQLTANPEWQRTVREDESGAVAGQVVQETLRLEQSEYLYRKVRGPLRIGQYRIPPGWLLRVCVQESHRDPTIFPDPDRFDPARFAGALRSRREYSPFGVDEHGCMGVPMVHFLASLFVEELCRAYAVRETRPAPLERGTRHRDHWKPGRDRRVRVEPLGGEAE